MKQAVKNPVVSKADAKIIQNTFVSATPKLPVSMMGFDDLATAMAENVTSDNSQVDKDRRRLTLSKRDVLLQDRALAGGWFNFGVPTSEMKIEANDYGKLQIILKNHRDEVVKCNLNTNGSNHYIATDLKKAFQIGSLTGCNVHVFTSTRGPDKWKATEWFDQVYVTFTAKRESK